MKKSFLFKILFAAVMLITSCNTDDISNPPEIEVREGNVIKFKLNTELNLMRPGNTKAEAEINETNYYMLPSHSYLGIRVIAKYGTKNEAEGTETVTKTFTFLKAVIPNIKLNEVAINLYSKLGNADPVSLQETQDADFLGYEVQMLSIENKGYSFYSPIEGEFSKPFEFMHEHSPSISPITEEDSYGLIVQSANDNPLTHANSVRPATEVDCPFYSETDKFVTVDDISQATEPGTPDWRGFYDEVASTVHESATKISYKYSMKRKFIGSAEFDIFDRTVNVLMKPAFAVLRVKVNYKSLVTTEIGRYPSNGTIPEGMTGIPFVDDNNSFEKLGAVYRLTSTKLYNFQTALKEKIGPHLFADKGGVKVENGNENILNDRLISNRVLYNTYYANYYPIEKMNIIQMIGDHTKTSNMGTATEEPADYSELRIDDSTLEQVQNVHYSEVGRFQENITDADGFSTIYIPVDLIDVLINDEITDKEIMLNLGLMINGTPRAAEDMSVPFPYYSVDAQNGYEYYVNANNAGITPAFTEVFELPQGIYDYFSDKALFELWNHYRSGYDYDSANVSDPNDPRKFLQRGKDGTYIVSRIIPEMLCNFARNLHLTARLEPAKIYNVGLSNKTEFGLEIESEDNFLQGEDVLVPID